MLQRTLVALLRLHVQRKYFPAKSEKKREMVMLTPCSERGVHGPLTSDSKLVLKDILKKEGLRGPSLLIPPLRLGGTWVDFGSRGLGPNGVLLPGLMSGGWLWESEKPHTLHK